MPIQTQLLQQFSLVQDISPRDLSTLAQAACVTRYRAGSLIFADGQVGDKFYLLKSGTVEIIKHIDNDPVILNLTQPGDYFGEMSLIDEQPRSASARARTNVTVIEIPKAAFLQLIEKFPLLLYRAARVSDERLRNRDQALLSELAAHNRQLEKLRAISLDISRHLELDEVLDALVRRATELLDGDLGVLHLYDTVSGKLVARSPFTLPTTISEATRRAFATNQPAIEKRARALAAPICLGAETIGVLTVYRPQAQPFTPDDANLLMLLANQSAIAIENARLYGLAIEKGRMDGELRAAQSVQRNLMPTQTPRIPGYQLAGAWQPARVVAGDFFDYIPLNDDRFAIVVADVSDKGMPAALFMAASRSIIRASVIEQLDPGSALTHANRLIASDSVEGMFVTLFLGIIDARAHRLTYANAGHNPPLVWRANLKRIENLRPHGLMLGAMEDSRYSTFQIDVRTGDAILFYTDGATDAQNQRQQFFGERRLRQVFLANAFHGAETLVHQIESAVREFVGDAHLFDDVTLVSLSRLNHSAKSCS